MNELDFRSALMVLSLLILGLSFAALLWVSWRHHRRGQLAQGNFHSSLVIEMAWTIAPCIIVLLLVWPIVRIFWVP
jgi:cytochrome c oxidase subunit II